MNGTLQEDLGGAGLDSVEDKAFAVLRNHASGDSAVHKVEELRGAGVRVGGAHATRPKHTDCHRETQMDNQLW